MRVILTDRNLTPSELATLPPEPPVYYLQEGLDLPRGNRYEIPPEEKRSLNYETLDFCLAFHDKIVDGKPLREWLRFGKAHVWYYHKFRLYFALRNLSYDLLALEHLKAQYEGVDFYTSRKVFTAISALSPHITIIYSAPKAEPINYTNLFHFGLLLLLRLIRSLGQYNKLKPTQFLIFNRPPQESPVRTPPDLHIQNENPYYGYLFGQINGQTLVLEEFDHPKLRSRDPFRITRRLLSPRNEAPHLYGDSMLIRKLLNARIRKQTQSTSKALQQFYPRLNSACEHPWEQALAFLLQQLHSTSRYYLFRFFAYQDFFTHHAFQRILTGDEGSPTIKAMLDAAKSRGIETVGLQHGTIHPLHMTYRFSEADMEQGDPIPDLTLVWGPYWKEVLNTYGNYPMKKMRTVGQARTDIIPYLGQLSREEVLADIPTDKKWVVFASQIQRDPILRERAALDVLELAAHNPEIFLIVKLHPRETDLSYYENLAQRVGCTNYIQVGRLDLYSLIAVCDVLITCFSTVGAETVYFHKPLVILDPLRQDLQSYIQEGVGFEATDATSLQSVVNAILSGEKTINQAAYQRFISRYAHEIDGNTSKRVWEVLAGKSDPVG